jgi:hypothetical protein
LEALRNHLRKQYKIADRMDSYAAKVRLLEVAREHGIDIKEIRGY